MKKTYLLMLCACLLVGTLAACSSKDDPKADPGADQPALQTVVFTEPVRTYHWAPAYLAQTLGFFAQEGLQAEFQTVTGADASAPIFAGAAQFGLRGVEMALMSNEAGQGCKILFSTTAIYPYQLIGASAAYDSIESLRGGVLAGGQGAASGPQAFIRAILVQAGMQPDLDASVVNMKSASYLAAIASGEVQAAVSTTPWSSKVLRDNGGVVIVDGADEAAMQNLLGSSTYELFMVFSSDAYIAENPETVQKVVNAIAKAAQWMESATAEEIAKNLEPLFVGQYEELLYSATVDKENGLSNLRGYHTPSGFEAAVKLTALSGGITSQQVTADQIYDESFLDKAWASIAP